MQTVAIMGVVPAGTSYPPGTPVLGTDFNAAYALLLRWWSVLDAPVDVDTSPFWEDLAEDDFEVELPGLSAHGTANVQAAVAELRRIGSRAHHLGFDDLALSWIGDGLYQLSANALEQTRGPDGNEAGRRYAYCGELRRRPDGMMVFRKIAGSPLEEGPHAAFADSYAFNRAKATMVQFQTHTDLLTGDAAPVRELLMAELELNGLVNSKADKTKADDAAFTDVRNLRGSISTGERAQDNVIRNFDEFSNWFQSCTALFRKNGFHKLERFEVTPMPDRRYQVIAQFHWRAETLNGAQIDLHTPLTWILVETGEKYMRIERLLPFG